MFSRTSSIFFVLAQVLAWGGYAQVTTFQWVQQPVGLTCLAADGSGNCYAAGPNGYVARYTPSGIVSWSKNISGLNNSGATAIMLGPKGEVYVAGYTYDTAMAPDPPGSLVNRMFLARLDAFGSVIWVVRSQNIFNASANAIAVSRSGGSVYLIGTESDTINFGTLGLGHSNSASIFVGRFDLNGRALWLRKSYSQRKFYNMSNGFSAAVDDGENVYVGGQFSDTLNFMGIHDSSAGSTEAIILSLDSSGKARWVKNFGANSSVSALCYADGYLFATGGPNIITRIRRDGTIDKVLQNTGATIASQTMASDGSGGILTAGAFSSSLSVGSVKVGNSLVALYLLKLDTGLRPQWATFAKGTVSNPAIASDSIGHHYLYGWTTNGNVRMGSTYIPGTLGFLAQIEEWSLACPLIEQGQFCSGDSLDIPVHAVGSYSNLNTFTAQISDSLGRFRGAQTIGGVTAGKVSSIRAVLPTSLHSGTKYRIRIVASKPEVVSLDNGYNLSVRSAPVASITPKGQIDLCEGDSITLTASGGEHYLWSNGDTTAQIVVGASGDYSVFATGGDGCGILLPATQVNVRLMPPVPPVTRSGNTLFGNLNGYDNQWYLNRSAIPGATGPTLDISYNGTYDLTVSNTYHCSSTSDDFVVADLMPSGVLRSQDISAALTLSPNPASQLVTASFWLPLTERLQLSITDLTGQNVITKNNMTYSAGAISLPIDIGRLPNGIYFVRLQTNEAVETRRLVVKR